MTGSASGMGQAVAERLRAAGATVIGVDRLAADLTVDLELADGGYDVEQNGRR